jgi:catechol 2,3-dioxygenase-like lactoylglutathione lyase family enzyme
MAPATSKLTSVAPVLRVAQLDRSIAYYRDRLGFKIEFEYEGFYTSVVRDGCRVHLKCSPSVERDAAAFEAAEHIDACFGVNGIELLASEVIASEASISVSLRQMPYGKEFYVRDPDGYVLGFVEAQAEQ